MSNHDHHDTPLSGMDKFVPLSDNNSNLALGKFLPLILSFVLVLSGVIYLISSRGGYLKNEEQVEWRKQHHKAFKDSHENKYYMKASSSDTHERKKEVEKKVE